MNRIPRLGLGCALILALAFAASAPAGAQSVASRVASVGDGKVRMTFAARPGVCGNGRSMIGTGGRSRMNFGESHGNNEWEDVCEEGPVRVSLRISARQVVSVRTYVGGRWRADTDAVDLGVVPARAAVDYLLDLAARGTGRAARDAILPATLADSAIVWPALLKLARDEGRPRETRRSAVFWLGQAAGEAATAGLDSLVGEDTLDREVREHAVFALSQRPREEGVPALIRIARTNRDPEVRKKALFWLGQSEDPRALALFEELLLRK